MSLLLRRVCTIAAVAGIAGLGLVAAGCNNNKHAHHHDHSKVVDSTPVIVGIGVSRSGETTVGYIVTPEGAEVLIESVEVSDASPSFPYADSNTITVTELEEIKATPSAYILVVDENKKITIAQKSN
jgi:hypothetical protein